MVDEVMGALCSSQRVRVPIQYMLGLQRFRHCSFRAQKMTTWVHGPVGYVIDVVAQWYPSLGFWFPL